MAGEWRETTLGEVSDFRAGSVFKPSYQGKSDGDVPFIKVSDMNLPENAVRIQGANNWVSKADVRELRATPLPPGAVVFAKIGEALRQNRLRKVIRETIVDNNMMGAIPRPDRLDATYFYYALSQFDFAEIAQGTALPYLTVTSISGLQLELPELPEQRAIAHILGTLDDKIELNRRMSATLGAMARALFKSWFVDFEPVRANAEGHDFGLPPHLAALFPDRLVDTDPGEIPAGWSYAPVSEFAQLKGGKQLEKQRFVEDGPVPVFGGAGLMGHTDEHNAEGYVISVGRVGAYCGQFFAHRGKAWINNNASLISQLDGVPGEWLLLSLRNLDMDLIKKGAAQPFVSNSDLAAMPIVAPPVPVLAAFHRLAEPLFRREELVRSEIEALAALRDALLSKLISGELRVKDAETFLDRVL